MMKSRDRYAVAVRKEDGSISVRTDHCTSVRKKYKILNIPILRGIVNFVEMMLLSYKTLAVSAEAMGIDDAEPENKFEEWLLKHCGKYLFGILMTVSGILGIVFAFTIFVYLPSLAVKGLSALFHTTFSHFVTSLIEGILKIAIFLAYLALVSLMKDIRRTFEYHGAEHKTIFCYENGEELTPENVKRYIRFHPRCGTSFIFVMLIIGILVGALPFIPTDPIWLRVICRLAVFPLIVGIGYEFLMFAGKHDNLLIRILSAPGLWVQRLTTREPDLSQIECAIAALKHAIPEEFPEVTAEQQPCTDEKADGEPVSCGEDVPKAEPAPEQSNDPEVSSADASQSICNSGTANGCAACDMQKGTPSASPSADAPEGTCRS